MKTIGRILIILAVTILIGAGIYALVDSNASSLTPGGFPGGEPFRPGGELPAFDGDLPGFPEGARPEEREHREMEGGWAFGLVKNLGVIAVFVTIIVLPSSLKKKNRIATQTNGNPPNLPS